METPSETIAAVSNAVSGPGTPDTASVTTAPSRWPLVALVLAGPAVSGMLMFCVWALVFVMWPGVLAFRSESLLEKIILAVAAVANALCVILGLVAFRLSSGGLKTIKAQAGPGSIEIGS